MNDTPMTSNQQIKLLIFAILLAPSIFFLVGIIPALFLIFGLVMMKKNSDFSHIETSGQYFKYYVYILLTGCALFALYFATTLGAEDRWDRQTNEFFASLSLGGIAIFYIVILNFLFLNPLRRHSEWVEMNGIFSSKAKGVEDSSDVDIIKGERLRTFSVADELIKWAKLKDDGHITEQEFNDARKKLLQ
ncbi:SHOCT domain-containing protein [Pseudomonas reactans]|uniref:SHOCT domain-containing protein n=1 Tax=Pseudomonas reactans TaxID=117680 RepID=UPI0015B9ECED|nr:SHOCT domain-containing protein [Pseudomonas reactans]NWD80906.1 SHOCT domain-containing protein [Pseudomonas reactans]